MLEKDASGKRIDFNFIDPREACKLFRQCSQVPFLSFFRCDLESQPVRSAMYYMGVKFHACGGSGWSAASAISAFTSATRSSTTSPTSAKLSLPLSYKTMPPFIAAFNNGFAAPTRIGSMVGASTAAPIPIASPEKILPLRPLSKSPITNLPSFHVHVWLQYS